MFLHVIATNLNRNVGTIVVISVGAVVIGVGPVFIGVDHVESVFRPVVFGISSVRSTAVRLFGCCVVGRRLLGRTSFLARLEQTLRHHRVGFGGDFHWLGVLGNLATNLGHHAVHGGVALVCDEFGVFQIAVVFHVINHILLEIRRLVVQEFGIDHQLQMFLILVEVLVGSVGRRSSGRCGRSQFVPHERRLFGRRLTQFEVGRFGGSILMHPPGRRSLLLGKFDQL